jgi:predicted nucleotidyltransferase
MTERVQTVVQDVARRLSELYGERLRGVVLYGSRARGDASDDSDFDFLVLLDGVDDFGADVRQISAIASELSLEFDTVVSALPVAEARFLEEETPLFLNARRKAIVVR